MGIVMNPDSMLEGLQRELERSPDRRAEIEAEMKRVSALPRPEATPEEPETVADSRVGYLEGLRRELERAEKSAQDAIRAEIKRVEAELNPKAERAARKQAVERTTAAPGEKRA